MKNEGKTNISVQDRSENGPQFKISKRIVGRPYLVLLILVASFATGAIWLGLKASTIRDELMAAESLSEQLKSYILNSDSEGASETLEKLKNHTAAARKVASNPAWRMVSSLPGIGPNFGAVSTVATVADDLALHAVQPLVRSMNGLDWNSFSLGPQDMDLRPLIDAQPKLARAAETVEQSLERLQGIETESLASKVADPVQRIETQLSVLSGGLTTASDVARLAPSMLGASEPRNYLLMIQNSAEIRASGGIPGALAVLNIDQGKLTLGGQTSASAIGVMSPAVPFDPEQRKIYSDRVGKYMQDVNLTPDFPTAAVTAQAMWERKTGQQVDGVISVDPVALAYILDATGPVSITDPNLVALAGNTLPTELTGENVVQTLLSDVYSQIKEPAFQDVYFAGIAQEIFAALSSGKGDAEGMLKGLSRGSAEGRILVWSGYPAEQSVIGKYDLAGSISGPSVSPAEYGVFFNDGTGAKMDYYVKRTVQLIKECPRDGYEQTTVRITQTNTAPADAATSLPAYVTGNGSFGVPPGSVDTNIVGYGPVQAVVETATLDGQQVGFAPYLHANRPVGVVSIRLAPGETRTVDMTFGRIVQHTEPNIVVTPTVQDVNDVLLPVQPASCG